MVMGFVSADRTEVSVIVPESPSRNCTVDGGDPSLREAEIVACRRLPAPMSLRLLTVNVVALADSLVVIANVMAMPSTRAKRRRDAASKARRLPFGNLHTMIGPSQLTQRKGKVEARISVYAPISLLLGPLGSECCLAAIVRRRHRASNERMRLVATVLRITMSRHALGVSPILKLCKVES